LRAAPPWLRATVQVWQAANAWWQDEFVGFNFTRQIDLIDVFGLRQQGWQALVWMLAGGGGLWLALIAWGYRPRSRLEQRDELARIWRVLERKLRARGGARSAHEGPLSYAERIGAAHPEHAVNVRAIARRYARLRYGPQPSAPEVLSLRRAVRWLTLRPQR
jgi:protein-glutamine gamma-glutamyltransferase